MKRLLVPISPSFSESERGSASKENSFEQQQKRGHVYFKETTAPHT